MYHVLVRCLFSICSTKKNTFWIFGFCFSLLLFSTYVEKAQTIKTKQTNDRLCYKNFFYLLGVKQADTDYKILGFFKGQIISEEMSSTPWGQAPSLPTWPQGVDDIFLGFKSPKKQTKYFEGFLP